VPPEEYAKSMEGTFLLGLEGNLKHFKEGETLDSLYGSGKIANAFNTKNKVYKESQDVRSYIDDSLVKEVAEKK
jgi:NitT/TauT family transport system substrate-binding protein